MCYGCLAPSSTIFQLYRGSQVELGTHARMWDMFKYIFMWTESLQEQKEIQEENALLLSYFRLIFHQ
jgi:hypothetical protein